MDTPPPWVGEYLRCQSSYRLEATLAGQQWAVRRAAEHVAFELNAYVLGRKLPPVVAADVLREPADWRQHWKLSRRWWTTCLDGIPLARWVKAHPGLARPLVRTPVGRWLLRRPLTLWLNRRWPVRYRDRRFEVVVPRSELYPHNELPEPSPERLGQPVVIFDLPELDWGSVASAL